MEFSILEMNKLYSFSIENSTFVCIALCPVVAVMYTLCNNHIKRSNILAGIACEILSFLQVVDAFMW